METLFFKTEPNDPTFLYVLWVAFTVIVFCWKIVPWAIDKKLNYLKNSKLLYFLFSIFSLSISLIFFFCTKEPFSLQILVISSIIFGLDITIDFDLKSFKKESQYKNFDS